MNQITKAINIIFGDKKIEPIKYQVLNIPTPTPREVSKILKMLGQVEVWINSGEKELAQKHWNLISDECKRYGQ